MLGQMARQKMAKEIKPVQPSPMSHTVPWIASGVNVKKAYTINRTVPLIDTGATILYALGLKTHTEWESHAVEEIFETVPKHRTTENDPPQSLY